MATADIFLKPKTGFGVAAAMRKWIGRNAPLPAPAEEDTRARIDFILEIMDTHPEAFASDECFRYSARHFSGRF